MVQSQAGFRWDHEHLRLLSRSSGVVLALLDVALAPVDLGLGLVPVVDDVVLVLVGLSS